MLIDRAGAAVARAALEMLGGAYGRRVVVVAGKGNNGADGRAAAARLRRRGVRVTEIDAADPPAALPEADLLDRRRLRHRVPWRVPAAPAAAGHPGARGRHPVRRRRPHRAGRRPTARRGPHRHLRGAQARAPPRRRSRARGRGHRGRHRPRHVGARRTHLVEPVDVARWLPARPRESHKWKAAVWVVAGSPGMTGAAHLAARAAQRGGAGYVRLSTPGVDDDPRAAHRGGGGAAARRGLGRRGAGRARAVPVARGRARVWARDPRPPPRSGRSSTPRPSRVGGRRRRAHRARPHRPPTSCPGGSTPPSSPPTTASSPGSVPTPTTPTASASPGRSPRGSVRWCSARARRRSWPHPTAPRCCRPRATPGSPPPAPATCSPACSRALLAQGVPALEAAAAAAHLHGRAGALALPRGLVAGDVVDRLPAALAELPED